MKITRVSGVVYRQQLKPGGATPKFAGEGRQAFETLLVKVETDSGITGWGEAFPHRVWPAVLDDCDANGLGKPNSASHLGLPDASFCKIGDRL